ncbi:FUN14 domain-containing protein 1, variant 2 [Chamberlinius hualienensis]
MPEIKISRNSDEEFEILDISTMGSNGRNWIRRQLDELNTAPTPKQIAVGGASGWLAGYAFAKVGKIAAISIGGSLLIMQVSGNKLNL